MPKEPQGQFSVGTPGLLRLAIGMPLMIILLFAVRPVAAIPWDFRASTAVVLALAIANLSVFLLERYRRA